jgi:FkbM family methyltransferase
VSILNLEFIVANRKLEFAMDVDPGNKTDQELITALRAGCPEPEVCCVMARVCKEGDFVIDGGANIGFFTVLISKLVGDTGHVLAFEPGQNNLFKLRENIKLNKAKNVELVPLPLWSGPNIVELYMCEDGSKNSLAAHAGTRGFETFKAVAINDYQQSKPPKLIKLDIEGAEEAALRGASNMIGEDGCPYIVMEMNAEALPKFGANFDSVRTLMRENGYMMFLLHPDGSLPTYVPRATIPRPRFLNWNVMFSTFELVGEAWKDIIV